MQSEINRQIGIGVEGEGISQVLHDFINRFAISCGGNCLILSRQKAAMLVAMLKIGTTYNKIYISLKHQNICGVQTHRCNRKRNSVTVIRLECFLWVLAALQVWNDEMRQKQSPYIGRTEKFIGQNEINIHSRQHI